MGSEQIDITALKMQYLTACAWGNARSKEVGGTSTKCHLRRSMWNTEWFESYIELPFENTTITCPAAYDQVLERHFGDWRTPVEGTAEHEMVAVDTETPWREFDMSSIANP